MSDKTDRNVSILKCMYDISSFRLFRFGMSLHEPSGFCLMNIGEMYSPVSSIADSSSFENLGI